MDAGVDYTDLNKTCSKNPYPFLSIDQLVDGASSHGMFLGYMLTRRDIKANPDKCEAVINMRSLGSVKEVQQLASRITTLSQILSRSIEKALPIFQSLIRNEIFKWMEEDEKNQYPIYFISRVLTTQKPDTKELTPTGEVERPSKGWMLSVDRALNRKGSGAGIMLEGPDGVLIEQTLQFKFKASNNQANTKHF
ncbi:hypothetical protein CR513_07838, partial [Mucuna pruriens]